jgi:hypothetical protein
LINDELGIESESNQFGNYHITIYDVDGKNQFHCKWIQNMNELLSKEIVIDKSMFQQGVYLTFYQAPWDIQSEKLIIVR